MIFSDDVSHLMGKHQITGLAFLLLLFLKYNKMKHSQHKVTLWSKRNRKGDGGVLNFHCIAEDQSRKCLQTSGVVLNSR